MNNSSLIKRIRRPFRPLKRFYCQQKERILFKRALYPTDIFLVGHPKSGNTMMAYILAIIIFKDKEQRINLANVGEFIPTVHNEDKKIRRYPSLSEPRVFRNEEPIYPELYPKTIYLVREPRAVLVSYYHMCRTVFNDTKTTMQDFVKEYLQQGCRYEPELELWDKQVLAWVKRARHDKRVIIVKYEDIVNNKPEVLKRIIEFADIPCTEEYYNLALTRSTFEAMRKNEEEYGAESYPGEAGKRGRFIRKGKIDGWKQELTQDIEELIENKFSEAMKKVGYL